MRHKANKFSVPLEISNTHEASFSALQVCLGTAFVGNKNEILAADIKIGALFPVNLVGDGDVVLGVE